MERRQGIGIKELAVSKGLDGAKLWDQMLTSISLRKCDLSSFGEWDCSLRTIRVLLHLVCLIASDRCFTNCCLIRV